LKSPMLLWKMIAEESAIQCCTSAHLDIKYVEARFKYEGISFLTISLPAFGKDIQKCLDLGLVDRNLFQGFSWQAGLPRLFGGFLDQVFDRTSGVLLDEPSVDAIRAIRQLTLMFGKILLPCTVAREKAAIDMFVQCEQDVRRSDSLITPVQWSDFERIGSLLFSSVFQKVDSDVYHGRLIPKHGPGATADKLRGNSKYSLSTWTRRLEDLFPAGEYVLPNWRYYDQLDDVDILEPGAEIPARVVSVPKTLKTPRIIAMEPTAMMYSQQALARSILEHIRGNYVLDMMLGFKDQIPNQEMAKKGSREGNLATLDLSEASDRVSNQHVRHLTFQFPHLHGALDACRSRKADIPGYGVKRLAKFASMGSALCFPMEAIVFLTLIFVGIEKELGTPLSHKTILRFLGLVRVYGDDIIVPVDCANSVIESLQSFGIKVNSNKSFLNGKFRESCGKEYYDGHDVSIVRIRREFPHSRKRVAEVLSMVSLRNQLYAAYYWTAVDALDRRLLEILRYFPEVDPTSPVVGRHTLFGYSIERYHRSLHSPLVKGWLTSNVIPKDPLEGHAALLKCLLMLEEKNKGKSVRIGRLHELPSIYEVGGLPAANVEHLERAGRPHAVTLKLRWASPF